MFASRVMQVVSSSSMFCDPKSSVMGGDHTRGFLISSSVGSPFSDLHPRSKDSVEQPDLFVLSLFSHGEYVDPPPLSTSQPAHSHES